jgi:ElaB/YqjD/DUF883 family membrane-anchored ribosome-binding protein
MPPSSDTIGRDARRFAGDARGSARDLGRDGERLADHVRQLAPEVARQARGLWDDGLGALREHGRGAADAAGDQLEDARAFMVDRVQERPITATLAALGVGFLLGLLISGSRR